MARNNSRCWLCAGNFLSEPQTRVGARPVHPGCAVKFYKAFPVAAGAANFYAQVDDDPALEYAMAKAMHRMPTDGYSRPKPKP